MPVVTVCTQVYNTAAYLSQCIESVLCQTYSDFEFFIIDNGCTDGSQDILKEYAKKDSRIKLIRFEKNKIGGRWIPIAIKEGRGKYLTNLDSDDWWEPDYLERLVKLAEKERLDIVLTGSCFHFEKIGNKNDRTAPKRMILEKQAFADYFPYYHVYFRTAWAKLLRFEVFRRADYSKLEQAENESMTYGLDTLVSFAWLRAANRICLDNSTLHHYLIHNKSISYQYSPKRFDSDTFLYQDAMDFLSAFGPISEENRRFLFLVYGNAIQDTLGVINKARLTFAEKLAEVKKIVCHPITVSSFQYADLDPSIKQNKKMFLTAVLTYGKQCLDYAEDFRQALKFLCPKTGALVEPEDSSLFLSPTVFETLMEDNPEKLRSLILDMVSKQQNTKQYDLGKLLQSMTPEKSLAHQIDDVRFIRKYRNLYENLCREDYLSVLDEMTELLLNNTKIYNEEFFLNIYIFAAALIEQVPAFLFGKTRMAQMYLQQGRRADCQTVLRELDEMGVENEEIAQIRKDLDTVAIVGNETFLPGVGN